MIDKHKELFLRFEDADTMLSIDAQKIVLLVNGMYDRFFARYSPERKEDTPLILEAFEDFALLADIAVEQAEHLKEHAQCLTDAVKDGYKMLWAEQAETREGPAIERLADALRGGTATPDQIEAAAGLLTRWAALLADVDTMTAYSAHYVELLAQNYLKLDRQRGFIPDSTKGGAEHDGNGAEALILNNRGLVGYAVRRFKLPGADAEDLFQIGIVGLVKAVDSFDEGRGVKLASYALRCIDNEILMALRVSQKRRREVSLDSPLLEDDDDEKPLTLADKLTAASDTVYESVRRQMQIEALYKALEACLSERERAIIVRRYGLDGQGVVNQAELARRFGISQSYVSRLEKRALRALKTYMTGTGAVEQTA